MNNIVLEKALDYIDENIEEDITVRMLASMAGYSPFHFGRLFANCIGMTVMAFVTWRKMQFALYDLSQGSKVIDIALKYGFETHAGFTRAFKRCFGYPPSLWYLHINTLPPQKETVDTIRTKILGGTLMTPHIIELTPFSVVGFPTRHNMADVRHTSDIPVFWDTVKMDSEGILTTLHDTFTKSKHFEICLCYDVDTKAESFTYMLGRGIDNAEDLESMSPDMTKIDISGGLYAIFSTTPVVDYTQTIHDTWNEILRNWLPASEFEFDETRKDFEYYDYRDHGIYFGGKVQMDICIPIRKK